MRLGICGLGMMGQAHLANALKIDGIEVAAVCDIDPERRAGSAEIVGNIDFDAPDGRHADIPAYEALGQMLADAELDAVLIATPTDTHAPLAIEALSAGLHVFSEKPIALTVESAEAMCEAAERSGKVLFIGHVVRFFPAYSEVRKMIGSGCLGAVLAAEFNRTCGLPGWGGDSWFRDPARSGGMSIDLHIHDADFVLHTFGSPNELHAVRRRDETTGVDVMRTIYMYREISVGSYGAWLQASAGFQAGFRVTFEQATIDWHTDHADHLKLYPIDGSPQHIALPDTDGYEAELREFAECVKSGRPSEICAPRTALAALELVIAELACALPAD
jgi:predicted dehydrogenase